jgi:hypothetical protein
MLPHQNLILETNLDGEVPAMPASTEFSDNLA